MSIDTGATPTRPRRKTPANGADLDATVPITQGRGQVDVTLPEAGAVAGGAAEEGLLVDGRYFVEGELGRGGMGVVYLARDASLDRPVALKMIAPGWQGDAAMAARFRREARALAAIRSQYVVQIHAFGEHEGAYFFAMEYVRGRTLGEILAEHRRHDDAVPQHRALTLLIRIARGIGAVHAAGIVHRDVKPSNVVIEEDTGRPVLVDFGIALSAVETSTTLNMGTPHYMAPEQAGLGVPGSAISIRTDVYALGVMAFELLAGRLPFDGNCAELLRQHAETPPPLLSSIRPDLRPFDEVISRALAKDPEARYPTCAAFSEALAAASRRRFSGDASLPPAPVPRSPVEAPVAEEGPDTPPRELFVLVVDDSPLFRRFAVRAAQLAFRERPVSVEGVGSGREAIEHAAARPPDLVLLDLDMPALDGIDTLSQLRALPGCDATRVVVVSGRVRPADRWRFAVLGVSDFLSKPIQFPALVDRINAIAKRHDASTRPSQRST